MPLFHDIRHIVADTKDMFIDINDLIILLHKEMAKATCETEIRTYRKILYFLTELKNKNNKK